MVRSISHTHIHSVTTHTHTQGWEEQTDAAISHLLRTTLAKSTRDQAAGGVTQELELPADSHKIKKHIALACDRISKGWMPGGRKIEVSVRSYTRVLFLHT